jgi:hypothetical protein
MNNIEEMIKTAKQYGLDIVPVREGEGGMFYINELGEKIPVNPEEFFEEEKYEN